MWTTVLSHTIVCVLTSIVKRKMQHPYFCNNARDHCSTELQGGNASFSDVEEEDVFEK